MLSAALVRLTKTRERICIPFDDCGSLRAGTTFVERDVFVSMKLIPLTQGKFAMVDDEDYEWLNSMKWHAFKGYSTWYAARKKRENGKRGILFMHQLVCKADDMVDHADGNGLNNTRLNLRAANQGLNKGNSRKWQSAASPFKGVGWNKKRGNWTARIGTNPNRKFLGGFKTDREAAAAYDCEAIKYYGEFAHLNFPSQCRS